MRFLKLSLVLVALWTWSPHFDAVLQAKPSKSTTDKDTFSLLVKKGSKYFEAKRYNDALDAFLKAYEIKPMPALLYNIARVYEAKGDLYKAVDYYKKFIAAPDVELELRKAGVERLKTIQEVIALTSGGGIPGTPAAIDEAGRVNINTASVKQLMTLPGIGKRKAQAIVQYRTQHGAFHNIEDLVSVKGIGQAAMAKLRPMITVGDGQTIVQAKEMEVPAEKIEYKGPKININTADADALIQFPGIGPSKAKRIVEDREAHGPYASCQDLVRVKGIGPGTLKKLIPMCTTQDP